MKLLRKLSLIVLMLMLLVSCLGKKEEVAIPKDYLRELENYKAKEKNKNNTLDDEEFNKFLDELFIKTVTDSYLYMHNNVADYKKAEFEKPEVKFGEIKYNDRSEINEYINELEELRNFDYDKLSYKQQYDYDLLEYSYLETIAYATFDKYALLFSTGNDFVGGIIVTLDEFNFYDEESLIDYLVLLKDVKRYLNEALIYTKEQTKDHIYTSTSSMDYTLDYIDSFTSKIEDNSLIVSFDKRIDTLDLNDDVKLNYQNQAKEIIVNEVIPAFKDLSEGLRKIKTRKGEDNLALCSLDQDYASITFMINTSSNDSVDSMFKQTEEVLFELEDKLELAVNDQDVLNEYYSIYNKQFGGFGLDDQKTLEYLEKQINTMYPSLDEYDYRLSRLDETSASSKIIAYYVSPPLDDLTLNVIRTNPNAMGNDVLSDYITLAHEGFPGHLYQNLYFQSTKPNRFRATQYFIGYDEGYACLAMVNALKLSGIKNENTFAILEYQTIFGYLIDSLVDMGVNYYGWSKRDTKNYIKKLGLNEMVDYAELYESAIDRPGVLDQYGVGFVKFYKLQEHAKEALGKDYDEKEFYDEILKHGPLPFVILEASIEDYLNNN